MRKILFLLTALTLALSVPMVAGASEYPTINDYRFVVEYDQRYTLSTWARDWSQGAGDYMNIGQEYYRMFNNVKGSIVRLVFDITDYLKKYETLIKSSTNAWLQVTLDCCIDSGRSDCEGSTELYYQKADGTEVRCASSYGGGIFDGRVAFSPTDLGLVLRDNYVSFKSNMYFYFDCPENVDILEIECLVRSFTATIYLQGVNGQDAEQFIVITSGLDDIESAVNNVRDEVKKMQGQLDNIDNSINQGFGQMGDKLDGVQDSINQGFGGILTPDSDDQQAAGGFLDKVEDNKQDAADINDQLSSVSKPDPDNLRDELSPDQFIDKDDASVQEMSGIIASVFDIDIMVKYILLLLGLGLISLVFFGKKEG